MSTKQTTDSTNTLNYNPTAEGVYNSMIGNAGSILNQYMTNPFGNAQYKMGLGQSMAGANQLGQQNISSLMNNMKVSGMSGNSGNAFQQAMMNSIGRGNQSMRSQANTGNVMSALQRQMQATGMGMSFSPQLTGTTGSSTSTMGGLGTWLPQLASALAGAGLGAATGGASAAAGAGKSAASSIPSFGAGPTSGFINSLTNPGFGSMPGASPTMSGSGFNPLMFMGPQG